MRRIFSPLTALSSLSYASSCVVADTKNFKKSVVMKRITPMMVYIYIYIYIYIHVYGWSDNAFMLLS